MGLCSDQFTVIQKNRRVIFQNKPFVWHEVVLLWGTLVLLRYRRTLPMWVQGVVQLEPYVTSMGRWLEKIGDRPCSILCAWHHGRLACVPSSFWVAILEPQTSPLPFVQSEPGKTVSTQHQWLDFRFFTFHWLWDQRLLDRFGELCQSSSATNCAKNLFWLPSIKNAPSLKSWFIVREIDR